MSIKNAYCFDLDGTVTTEEILPILSKDVDLHEEISALTTATINGTIPFKESFLLRCKLLSTIPVVKVHQILEKIIFYKEIEKFIKSNNQNCYIVTGNLDIWIEPLIKKLNCNYFSSKGRFINDNLVIDYVINKGDAINELRKKYEKIISIGDGMGDVQMFENSDVSIAFGGTHEPVESVIKLSDYVTYNDKTLCKLLNTQL
ncbi:HAD-IB family phosphatase [Pelagibacterales bacterium]|nr:HAD-IB family phosphatase [Pelagibacterales bacterium]